MSKRREWIYNIKVFMDNDYMGISSFYADDEVEALRKARLDYPYPCYTFEINSRDISPEWKSSYEKKTKKVAS